MAASIPAPRFNQFYRHADLTRLLQDYAAALPGLVQLDAIGTSHEGHGKPGSFSWGDDWCPEEDSNLHALRHWYLKPARLPIPPSGQMSWGAM